MRLKKLLEQTDALFNADSSEGKRKKRIRNLKKVLKKLSKKAKSLEKRRKKETNPDKQEKLDDKIALTQAQRLKGLKILKKTMLEKTKS
ncbi:MAG: hypothetical protein CR977_01505 [Gammaproteobacteria bacterium]|nr:MAG: hypothetical protein CR977_01505 [Gammaproteobacteria bacterium]